MKGPRAGRLGIDWVGRTPVLLLAGAFLTLFFAGLGRIPLFEPDEGRYTEIPREMLESGDFVLPHLNGVLYFEKPPLYYWLNAISRAVIGPSEFASRFWSAALGLLGLSLVFILGRRIGGRRAGWLSLIVLGTSPLYLALAHITVIDMTLTFFFTLTLVCFFMAVAAPDGGRAGPWWYGAFAGAALSVLSKGLIGLVLPAGIAGLYVLLTRRWARLKRAPLLKGTLLFLAIALPWHVLAQARSQDFLWFYIIREHFLRFLTTVHDRSEPVWFFLPVIAWALLPWTGLLPAAFAGFVKGLMDKSSDRERVSAELFLWIWAGVIVLFFSASHSKLVPYVLPAVPPLAILAGLALAGLLEGLGKPSAWAKPFAMLALAVSLALGGLFGAVGLRLYTARTPAWPPLPWLAFAGFAVILFSVLGLVCALRGDWRRFALASALCASSIFASIWSAAPQIQAGRNAKNFAAFLKEEMGPGDLLLSYRCYPQTLPVYLGRTIGVAAFEGEQEFGASALPEAVRRERFPTAAQFREMWESGRRIYCLTDKESLAWLDKDRIEPRYVLRQEGLLLLITNSPPDAEPRR